MNPVDLDDKIIDCHARGDVESLVELYQLASEMKREAGDNEAAGFLLTQAYVFALECNHTDTVSIRTKLAAEGRELSE